MELVKLGIYSKDNSEFIKAFSTDTWNFAQQTPLFKFLRIMQEYARAMSKLGLKIQWIPHKGVCITQDYITTKKRV